MTRPPPSPRRAGPSKPDPRPVIAVLGIGQMGLVCARLAASASDESRRVGPATDSPPARVVLWGHNADEAGRLAQTRRSDRLPGFVLPDEVEVVLREDQAIGHAALVVSAIPVPFMREVWRRAARYLPESCGVLSVAKGVEVRTLLRPTQIVAEVLRESGRDHPDRRPRPVGCLSGPTIAAELARCLPAAMIGASDDPEFARVVQRLFSGSWMRVYTHSDVLGVELGGACKNVIAIAAGILDGLQAGYNAKSALLARGLAEIVRLGVAMGASHETFFGIAGLGDLATTCFSPEGRNRSLGEALGRGESLDDYLGRTRHVVEGVATSRAVLELARKFKVEMPITAAVHAVLFEGVDPIEAIGRLMSRELKPERVG